jgi:ATP phosphoribosyltransferase regulatory subunit
LLNTNRDLDLQTFKVTDQLSGRTMGIRADITPQAARIDAHSLNREGPVRLCYAASVLHSRPNNALASRSPVQLGAECFGISDLMADGEVISLMVETLQLAGIGRFVVSLGHVEIFRLLAQQSGLSPDQMENLLDILQRKARVELEQFFQECSPPAFIQTAFTGLLDLNGDTSVLDTAKQLLQPGGEKIIAALTELEQLTRQLALRYSDLELHIDLAEVPGYHYHNGVVFAAYAEGNGAAIANGGRYDALSSLFGRKRPATGFNADLKTLFRLGVHQGQESPGKIVAVWAQDAAQWQAVCQLRESGETVICVPHLSDLAHLSDCPRQLVFEAGRYVVRAR